ncbi:MAG: hypothetical protein NC313_04820 [Butyrivibrio sp.]|nr:hypothetical protein [Butyrivibrio sp.]
MRVLLTSAGLETEEIKEFFMGMAGKDMSLIKALFIPTAAIHIIYWKELMRPSLISL